MEKHSPIWLWPHSLCLLKSRQWQAGAGGGRRRGGFKVNLAMQLCTRIAVGTENWHKLGNESKRQKLKMWTRKKLFFLFLFFFPLCFFFSFFFGCSNLDHLHCSLPPSFPWEKKRGTLINQCLFLLHVWKCFNAKSLNCRLLHSHIARCELCIAIQSRY